VKEVLRFGKMTGNGYLHWAKVHRRVQYELTNSGVPSASLNDIGASSIPVDLVVQGPYGHPSLIERIAGIYAVDESRVVPIMGASSGIFLSLGATIARGDPVALESPCYDPAVRAARFLGADILPIVREPNKRFRVQLHEIESQLKAGVRAVFLTNLHNPSGQFTDRETMREIAHLCLRRNATLIVDEVYLDAAHLNLGQPRWSAARLGDNVVAINSLTKIHGLGGIRAGWIVANKATANRVRQLVNLINGDNPAPSEGLALQAFSRLAVLEERFRRFYRVRVPGIFATFFRKLLPH